MQSISTLVLRPVTFRLEKKILCVAALGDKTNGFCMEWEEARERKREIGMGLFRPNTTLLHDCFGMREPYMGTSNFCGCFSGASFISRARKRSGHPTSAVMPRVTISKCAGSNDRKKTISPHLILQEGEREKIESLLSRAFVSGVPPPKSTAVAILGGDGGAHPQSQYCMPLAP